MNRLWIGEIIITKNNQSTAIIYIAHHGSIKIKKQTNKQVLSQN